MQLYEVSFKIEHRDTFEIGKILVTGSDKDEAIKKTAYHLDLNKFTNIRFNIIKIKPQFYQLDRTKIRKYVPKYDENGNIIRKPKKFKSTYMIAICAEIFTESREMALQIIGKHIKMLNENPNYKDDRIPTFEYEIEEKSTFTQGLQQPYIDKQSIFKEITLYRS